MDKRFNSEGYLAGQMLIAMPQMQDPRFARTVVYVCAHTAEGAMGLVVNRLFDALSFPDLLQQLDITPTIACDPIRVHFGGPVESGRGFVLHSGDYCLDTTLMVDKDVGLTATVDVLKAIAHGEGPSRSLLALGYSGWSAGQLDSEILENSWLNVPADPDLLFGTELDRKWERALAKLGANPLLLSTDAGHA
jgi:putative transcriptional regulator